MAIACITGASSGIGLHLAEQLAAKGFELILVARNNERLQELAAVWRSQYRVQVTCHPVDLADPVAVERLCAVIGVPDVLVNNAGFGDFSEFHAADWDKLQRVMQVNVLAVARLCHQVLAGMRQRGSGRILNVASSAGFSPGPMMAVYFATKAFVLHFSEALATECRGSGVTVTTLCPGATATEFHKAAGFRHDHLLFTPPIASHPAWVARVAVKAMLSGKRLSIPGITNQISVLGIRVVPRWLAARIASWALRR
jgi:uncharacterized protein